MANGSDPSFDDDDYLHMFSAAPSKKKSGALQPFRRGQSPMNLKMKATDKPESETLRKLQSFKQFDTVIDISDHHYIKKNSSMKHNPKNWAKKIQEEWRILEKHLPDTIFVRVYESRMDLMRAVIIGAQGTPYHDGLFFFDLYFPPEYPDEPPQLDYHSGGLGLNPNLYENGYVCLSLLNTWVGDDDEMWTPGVSTMHQVLVSIQGLILNAKPYFNESGFLDGIGPRDGENRRLCGIMRICSFYQ
ncbi:putative aminoacyltransferase, E1 ubiquitin-activating enzyme [Medicago truncatula]|uniref:Putative aminoacyltransferase, E1 ubiquitin-activating enzyme n=1 Tax=Medicago truncatula TaxID=3880 RepID=A0A396GX09_MEDTR|nr:putative aminoacyltransferase, E1 ubiquitin-activating enzyme [Medicago truncatula]